MTATPAPQPSWRQTTVVTGQPVQVEARPTDTVLDVRRRAVAALGYDDGAAWEVRDPAGNVIDQTGLILDVKSRIFVTLTPGYGA